MNMLTSSGRFKEHILTGGFFVLSIFILLELMAPGDVSFYFNWLYCEFLPISQSVPGMFFSAVTSSVVLFSIIIGFILELLGSVLFMAEVVVLQDEIKKDKKSFSLLFPDAILQIIEKDIECVENHTARSSITDMLTLRKSYSNIESFLVLHCMNTMDKTQDILLRKMTSMRIVRSLSHLYLLLVIFFLYLIPIKLFSELRSWPVIIVILLSIAVVIIFIVIQTIWHRLNRTTRVSIIGVALIGMLVYSLCFHPDVDYSFLVFIYGLILFLLIFGIERITYRDYIGTLSNMIRAQHSS